MALRPLALASLMLLVSMAPASGEERVAKTRIAGWDSSVTVLTVGARFKEKVRVAPRKPRREYVVRWRRDGRAWKARQAGRATRAGVIKVRYRPPAPGRYAVRVVVRGQKGARRAVTPVRRIRVAPPQQAPQPATPTPTPTPTPTQPVPVATPLPRLQPAVPAGSPFTAHTVGDMGWCHEDNPDNANQLATSSLIPDGGMLLGLGDLAQNDGSAANFANCYLPAYARLLDTTYPVPGNHEYVDPLLAYFSVFGDRVGTRERPWYGFQQGSWSFYQLNSNCKKLGGCGLASAQYRWLAAQLAIDTNRCIAMSWHHPRWAATTHGPYGRMADMYALAARSGVDIVLSGHEHMYQRFPRLAADGTPSAAGPRQFIVGTGGMRLANRKLIWPQLPQAYVNGTHGVMRVRFLAEGYEWQFLPVSGPAGDSGADSCGGPPVAQP